MSRPLRIQYKGAFYHVMNRGNARQDIFKHSDHYNLFLHCLTETIKLWEIRLHAFSLMPNHYHLLIETPKGNLSRAMRHLNHVYTQRFNRLAKQDGHLFRGRYKSILIEEDAYLVELLRYIHLNPVKGGEAKSPQQYKWSSHRLYLTGEGADYLTTSRILSYFGKRKNTARRRLHEFVISGVPGELESRLASRRWPSVLSRENFEEWVCWNFVKDLNDDELEYIPDHLSEVSEAKLKRVLCQLLEIDWVNLKEPRGREHQKKRAQVVWFYRRYLKWGYKEISREFGIVPSRISKIMYAVDLVDENLQENVRTILQK